MDDYHVPQVHPTSFQPPLDDWHRHMRYERPGGPSAQSWDMRDESVANWARMDRRLRFDRHGDYTGYRHLYLFPCLYISTVYSGFVVLHRLIPQAVDRTVIEWTLCLPLVSPISPARATMRGAVIRDLADGARRVIGEDVGICALAQRGRSFAVHPPIYGAREARLVDYEAELLAHGPISKTP